MHICYGYGIKANVDWKETLGSEWRQYEEIFPAINASRIDQVSLECADSKVPLSLIGLLKDKEIMVGAIDVATNAVETPEQVAATIARGARIRRRRAAVSPAPIAASRRCPAALPRGSSRRSGRAPGWPANGLGSER